MMQNLDNYNLVTLMNYKNYPQLLISKLKHLDLVKTLIIIIILINDLIFIIYNNFIIKYKV